MFVSQTPSLNGVVAICQVRIGDLHVNQGFISDESHAFVPFHPEINLKFHVTLSF